MGRSNVALAAAILVTAIAAMTATTAACADHTRSTPARERRIGTASRPRPFVATAYCLRGTTADGSRVRAGVVAADPAMLPIGTTIRVGGLTGGYNRTYTVADTGPRIRGRRIDLFVSDCREARRFGRRRAMVSTVCTGC